MSEQTSFGLPELFALVQDRKEHPVKGSYTCSLLEAGEDRILRKVGEEAIEVIIATKGEGRVRVVSEVADLLYHLLVLLVEQEIPLAEIEFELSRRHGSPSASASAGPAGSH